MLNLATTQIEEAIDRGIKYLFENQLPTGEFKCYRARDFSVADSCEFDSSTFPTALITYCLSFSDSAQAKQMAVKANNFLLAEMEPYGLWRYWTKRHIWHDIIPPDVDDTAAVSLVLKRYGIEFPDNRALLLANRNRRGLFYTWFVPHLSFPPSMAFWHTVVRELIKPVELFLFFARNEAKPNDVDAVVNANAICYLGKQSSTKAVIDYLIDVIDKSQEQRCDKWHLSPFNLYYSVSRNAFIGIAEFDTVRNRVIEKIVSRASAEGLIGANILETALAACSLLNWQSSSLVLDRAVETIIAQQSPSGAWCRLPLYYGGPKRFFGWGSEELTTGFCLEALVRYFRWSTQAAL